MENSIAWLDENFGTFESGVGISLTLERLIDGEDNTIGCFILDKDSKRWRLSEILDAYAKHIRPEPSASPQHIVKWRPGGWFCMACSFIGSNVEEAKAHQSQPVSAEPTVEGTESLGTCQAQDTLHKKAGICVNWHIPAPQPVAGEGPRVDHRKAVEDWFKLPYHDLGFQHEGCCEGTRIINTGCVFCLVITAMVAYKLESATEGTPKLEEKPCV